MSRLCFLRGVKAPTIHILEKHGFLAILPLTITQHLNLSTTHFSRSNLQPKQEIQKDQNRFSSKYIVQSPLGRGKAIPHESLVEYVYKNVDENVIELPAATCAATGRSYNYGMLRMLVNRFAQALVGHCGMAPREVIGLLLPNIPEFIVAAHGAMEAGLTVTFVNPLYTPDELGRQFENAEVKMIVTIPLLLDVATMLGSKLSGYRGTVCIGGEDDVGKKVYGLESLLKAGHEADLPGVNPMELALLPYSSGTTGLPKGVMLSHYNLVSNLVQADDPAIMDVFSEEKDSALEEKSLEDIQANQQKVLTVLPFFHIYGFNAIMNLSVRYNYHIVTLPRFVPDDYIGALEKYQPHALFVVPSLLLFLTSSPLVTEDHLKSVNFIQSGAAPLPEGLVQRFKQKFGSDKLVRQGYGMTESSPVTFCMPKLTPPSKHNTIGIPLPRTEAKILDLTTGEPLGTNQPGELLVRGPQIMMGYLNNEKATAETVDEDGWLHTGDVAYYDEDRYFFIIDRCKELIKVKGNQVSPTELENILLEIPDVIDAAVVGIPDALAEEVPKAFVVKRPDAKVDDKDVIRYVNSKVVHYKKLAGGVQFLDSIPRNPSGKILRNELKVL